MAEGFEPYHVPQQSRRDKLRVQCAALDNHHHHPLQQGCAGLLPLYDPSLLLSCAAPCSPIKEETHLNLISLYNMDPQNPNNNNPFLFAPQNISLFSNNSEPLSLSLSSNKTHEASLPLELNLQRYDGSAVYDVVGSGPNDLLSRNAVPLGPFTGYASVLKGSRFLKPAQLLLEEVCDVGRGRYGENVTPESGLMDPAVENLGGGDEAGLLGGIGKRFEVIRFTTCDVVSETLDTMELIVYRRYKYYYQQMQAVVASFESVAGLSNAAPYANLALKAMSKHFRSLKNAITDQLQFTSKAQNYRKDETQRFGNSDNIYSQRAVNSSGIHDQPVWRPQRGLPERAVSVLRSCYPTDTDKLMLAKQTGLSRNQVSNWFINARVRLWKPMVEEIHMLETRQSKKASQMDEQNADRPTHHLPSATSIAAENPSTSTKRTRNEFLDIPSGINGDPMSLSYANLSHHQHMGAGTSNVVGSGGVSLTLGLHQNNGIGLSEPFPIHAARRFGLDSSSDAYAMGGFEDQSRHFGRDYSGGQLLHDFVG
ncbi:hypothetical protein RHMOL_Rhmol05G0275100 [Rhododendron molle]|uniref:Uncharacterized protein n=1 Tax=Rhododendron molle TaxID=49168 RepID=A0ACC0NTW5_RHOML|nr:hypothetical protein RHMOL_Rhmol05G0275100 [Rhododendron molle]